jgi:hypothetical protein
MSALIELALVETVLQEQIERCREAVASCSNWSSAQAEWSRARDALLNFQDALRAALANPATIRDTDEDAGDAAWLRQLFPVSNTYAKARERCERIANRLASSTPAEPREASGYCPFCMTADPVAPAEGDASGERKC